MSPFKPEKLFVPADLEYLGSIAAIAEAEVADFTWTHHMNVERLEEEGVIDALGEVLLRNYFAAAKAAADQDDYSVEDTPYRYDGDPDRLIISKSTLTTHASRSVIAAITLKTDMEDYEGRPYVHLEKVEVARVDTDLPMPRAGFQTEHGFTLREICEGRELAKRLGVLPHLNASLGGLSAVPEDSGWIHPNINLGDN